MYFYFHHLQPLNHRTCSPPGWTVSAVRNSGCISCSICTPHLMYSPMTLFDPRISLKVTASTIFSCPHRSRTSLLLHRTSSRSRRFTCMSGCLWCSWSCSGWSCSRICRSGWWGSMRIATVGWDTPFSNTLKSSNH